MGDVLDIFERLDLSYQASLAGPYFDDIIGILSILFGGGFLLFSWKHHRYFLGMTGFLTGCFAGLLFKANVMPEGGMGHIFYIVLCGLALGAVSLMFPRFVGMMMGGFVSAIAITVVSPKLMEPERHNLLMLSIGFTLGGGLGAIFPRFFYIVATSLIGSAFVTYGVAGTLLPTLLSDPAAAHRPLWHAMVLLPLFLFGVCYQMMTTQGESPAEEPAPPKPRPQPAAR
jgi:hypothetical protein